MTHTAGHTGTEPDIEDFFASLAPSSMRDAAHLREIAVARRDRERADDRLRDAVRAARDAGDSWTVIGVMLGTSKQNAYRKYGQSRRHDVHDSRRTNVKPSSGE